MTGSPAYHAVLDEMRAMHEKKSADYGVKGGDPLANCRGAERLGIPAYVGVVTRMQDKMQRIESFVKNGRVENESLEDSLLDLANYSAIALALYREGKAPVTPEVFKDNQELLSTLKKGDVVLNSERPGNWLVLQDVPPYADNYGFWHHGLPAFVCDGKNLSIDEFCTWADNTLSIVSRAAPRG